MGIDDTGRKDLSFTGKSRQHQKENLVYISLGGWASKIQKLELG